MIDIFEIGTIKRLPLETSYTNVVAIVHALLLRCSPGTELIIDGTGVGKPVADIFKWHGVTPWCVTATAGIEQTIDAANLSASNIRLRVVYHERRMSCVRRAMYER
jgi:hypothetical protein